MSPLHKIALGCKALELKHVLSFMRQVFIMLKDGDISLKTTLILLGEQKYVVYRSMGKTMCFHCPVTTLHNAQ